MRPAGALVWVVVCALAVGLHVLFCDHVPRHVPLFLLGSGDPREFYERTWSLRDYVLVPPDLSWPVTLVFGLILPIALVGWASFRVSPRIGSRASIWPLRCLLFLLVTTGTIVWLIPQCLLAVPIAGATVGAAWLLVCTWSILVLAAWRPPDSGSRGHSRESSSPSSPVTPSPKELPR